MKKIDIEELEKWIAINGIEETLTISILKLKDFINKKKAQPEPCCANCKWNRDYDTVGELYCCWFDQFRKVTHYCREWRKEG